MKILVIMTTLAMTALPSLAGASCKAGHVEETAASRMPGTVWDETTATCVEAPSA